MQAFCFSARVSLLVCGGTFACVSVCVCVCVCMPLFVLDDHLCNDSRKAVSMGVLGLHKVCMLCNPLSPTLITVLATCAIPMPLHWQWLTV